MTINDMLESVARLNLRAEIPEILERTEESIVSYNRDQLFFNSENSNGGKLTEYKNNRYAKKKALLNPVPGFGHPDLKLTGKFYAGFYITVKPKEFEIDSFDGKSGDLKSKYGESLFGLTNDSMGLYANAEFIAEIKRYIEETTVLKFNQ